MATRKKSTAGETRRTKRKADDADKQLPGTARKRPSTRKGAKSTTKSPASRQRRVPDTVPTESAPSLSTNHTTPSPAKKARVRSSRGAGKQSMQERTGTISEKDRQDVTSLLQMSNLDKTVITAINEQINSQSISRPSMSTKAACTTLSAKLKKRRLSSELDDLEADNEYEEEDEEGFEQEDQDVEDLEEEDDDDDGMEDDEEVPDFQADEHRVTGEHDDEEADEDDCEQVSAPQKNASTANLGESDDEQDVSFHDGRLNEPEAYTQMQNSQPRDGHNDPVNDEQTGVPSGGILQLASEATNPTPRLLGADESTILHLAKVMKQYVFNELQSSFKQVLHEIRTDRDQLRKLNDHVTELTSIVTTTATAIFIKHTASQPRGKEIQRKLCLLPALFTDRYMLKIVPRVVIGFFANAIVTGSTYALIEMKGVEFFSLMYFSKRPGETKDKFESEIGKIYSRFRYSLLTTSFLAMQENSFSLFSKSTNRDSTLHTSHTDTIEESSTITPSISAMQQPFWLMPGYVKEDHCVSAAKKQEKRGGSEASVEPQTSLDTLSQHSGETDSLENQEKSQTTEKQKVQRSGPLTHDEIATEAACMVYRIITAILSRSRTASKVQLFHDVTYLFVGWLQHKAPVDQNTLTMRWEKEITGEIAFIDDLSRTKLINPKYSSSVIGREIDKIHMDNMFHLETLIGQHPELSLIVEHNVVVDGSVRRLRYRVNLLEVVCRSLAGYITLDSASNCRDALCVDKRCLKVIMAMAIGLRRILKKAIDDVKLKNEVPWLFNKCPKPKGKKGRPGQSDTILPAGTTGDTQRTPYKYETVDGMNLSLLQPAPSKQKEMLANMILNMTEEEYCAKSMQVSGQSTAPSDGHVSLVVDDRITADESQGVFRF